MFTRANSSSCGRSQPVTTSSIGRFLGSNARTIGGRNQDVHKKVMRGEALVRRRARMPLVEHQQLVQQRRAAPPMAEHEQRRLLQLRRGEPRC